MANKITIKKSSVAAKVPLTTDLDFGELAINYADEKLYFKNSSGTIQFIPSRNSPSFAGTPTSTTAALGTNTTQIATTAFVQQATNVLTQNGNNLVTNGNGILGTNYNWSQTTTISNDTPTGAKLAFRPVGSGAQNNNATSFLIPVDPAKKYYMSGAFKQLNAGVTARAYLYLAPYDGAGNSIRPYDYMEQLNTRTTLAAPLNNGDTTITLTSAANWWNSTQDHRSSIIFWNWTDSFGKTWPPGTYSRNYWAAGLWDVGGITGNVITLKAPWAGGSFAAGHVVGNGSSGGSYLYPWSDNVASTWTNYVGSIVGGIHTDITLAATNAFPIATASALAGVLCDYNATGGTSQIIFSNVYFQDVFLPNIDQLTPTTKSANTFFAAPSGSSGNPQFRALTTADVPQLNQNTTGSAAILSAEDNRTISPNELQFNNARFGFTSWSNNNSAPYADFLHFNGYSDATGGNQNLVTFRKDAIGIRVWQQAYASASAYATYKDVAFTDSNITGSAASLTTARTLTIGASGKSFNGTANVSWTLGEIGAQETLVSGTNIKTINGASIMGSGNLTVTATGGISADDALALSIALG